MELNAPGLKKRQRGNGQTAHYWVASAVSRDAGDFPLKTVRVHGTEDEIAQKCRNLTAELREYLSGRGIGESPQYDGTLKSVIRLYQRTKESLYFEIKSNTRAMYDESLKLLETTVGARKLDKVTGLDIRRWYANFKAPAADGMPERTRRAYKAMQLLRIVIGFGVVLNIQDCFRLKIVLEEMRFSVPGARKEMVTFEQAQAICEKAIELGMPSIAIAQAFQFELTLRQIDVVGRWEKIDNPKSGGIVDRGQRWRDGLVWSDIDEHGILSKDTSKTGQAAGHDTTAYPFLRSMMDLVPIEKRFGPIVICEATGLPYRYRHFAKTWREVARLAGVPDNVWNRDSRAGGITEGGDAGANINHLRHHANHSSIQMTQRYDRKTVTKTRAVAELRVAARNLKNASEK